MGVLHAEPIPCAMRCPIANANKSTTNQPNTHHRNSNYNPLIRYRTLQISKRAQIQNKKCRKSMLYNI